MPTDPPPPPLHQQRQHASNDRILHPRRSRPPVLAILLLLASPGRSRRLFPHPGERPAVHPRLDPIAAAPGGRVLRIASPRAARRVPDCVFLPLPLLLNNDNNNNNNSKHEHAPRPRERQHSSDVLRAAGAGRASRGRRFLGVRARRPAEDAALAPAPAARGRELRRERRRRRVHRRGPGHAALLPGRDDPVGAGRGRGGARRRFRRREAGRAYTAESGVRWGHCRELDA